MSKALFNYSRIISYVALIGCLSLLFAVPLDSPRIAVVVSLCNVILAVWLCILLVKRAEHDATLQNLWLTNRRVLLDNMEHIYKSLRDLVNFGLAKNAELDEKQVKTRELASLLDQKIKEMKQGENGAAESSALMDADEYRRLREQWEADSEPARIRTAKHIADLEAQIRTLEEKAKVRVEEIKKLEAKTKKDSADAAEAKKALAAKEKEQADDKALIEKLKKQVSDLEAALKKLTAELETARKREIDATEARAKSEAALAAANEACAKSEAALAEAEQKRKEEGKKLHATMKDMQAQIGKVGELLKSAEDGLQKKDEALAKEQAEKAALQAELDAARAKADALAKELAALSGTTKNLGDLQKQYADATTAADALKRKIAELEAHLAKEEHARKAAEAEADKLRAELEALRKAHATALADKEAARVAELAAAHDAAEKEKAELRGQIDELQKRMAAEHGEAQRLLEAELAKAKATAKQAAEDLTKARGQLDAQKQEIAALHEKEAAASDALAKLSAQLKAAEDAAKSKEAALQAQLDEANALIADLRSKLADLEGAHNTARSMLTEGDAALAQREAAAQELEALLRKQLAEKQKELEALEAKRTKEREDALAKTNSFIDALKAMEAKVAEQKAEAERRDRDAQESMRALETKLNGITEEVKRKLEAELKEVRAALAESEKQRKAEAEALAAAAAKSAAQEEEAAKLRARVAELEKQLSDALSAGNDKDGKSDALAKQLAEALARLAEAEKAAKELAAAKAEGERRHKELQTQVQQLEDLMSELTKRKDAELELLKKQLRDSKATELSVSLASDSPLKRAKSPSPMAMAVSSPAERPAVPAIDAKAADALRQLLAALDKYNRADTKDPQALAEIAKKFRAAFPASSTAPEKNGAAVLADLLECAVYAIQQRAADPDQSMPDLDTPEVLSQSALVAAESLRLLLALVGGADLADQTNQIISIDAHERAVLDALYATFRTKDDALKRIAGTYNAFDYWFALLINSPHDIVRDIFLHMPIMSPAKKNYVVVFMKVADTDKKVAPDALAAADGSVTPMQQQIMEAYGLSASEYQAAFRAFSEADRNGDGHLSSAEAADLAVKLLKPSGDTAVEMKRKAKLLIMKADRDMNGTISIDELLSVYGKLHMAAMIKE